jgi:ElaB/YqjD/DUF883 family membrane-anchored ribosome-binding protein
MANEEVIRHQMEETRTSLTEKLETLEQKVVDTVQGATTAVSETVQNVKDSVQETVSTVKDTVEGTVCAVKESVAGGVETVKEYMDIRGYVQEYPWLMTGSAVAVGYTLGCLLFPKEEPFKTAELAKASDGPRVHNGPREHIRNGGHRARKRTEAAVSWLGDFAPELNKLKGLALGTLLGSVREMVTQGIPGQFGEQVKQVIDKVTTKLGGQPLASADLPTSYHTEGGQEERHQTEMAGSMGPAHRQGQKGLGRFDR